MTGTVIRSRVAPGASTDGTTAAGTLLDSTRVNGRLFVDSTDLASRFTLSRSAMGRRATSTYDMRGQTLAAQAWSRLGRTFSYDSAAQLVASIEGGLVDSVQWNALGYPVRLRRADGAVTSFERDSVGRVLSRSFAAGLTERFAYDAEGNPSEANLLGGRRYTFTYDAHGLLTADSLASAGLELGRYTYDAGRKLRQVSRPGRNPLALSYDAAGRLLSVASATIDTRMTYQPGTGLLSSVSDGSGAMGQAYALQYNGRLPTSITASGLVNGRVDYTYTSDLWLKSAGIAGRTPITYDYDADGLVTRGGALTLKRDPVTGAITGDTIGVVGTSRTYDDHGALSGIELRVKGLVIWSQRLTRDSIGRIVTQRDSDATAGVVVTGYHYDAQDRLDQVTKGGAPFQAFTFDAAGNRTTVTTGAGIIAATYASDDRIVSYDGQAITHDASGARASEVRGADTLGYQYDDLGRLTQLSSTTSGALTFQHDALGRRVQELRGGAVVRSFLYGGSTAPSAELTATGALQSEFVQIAGDVAPDYIIQGTTTYYLVHDQLGSVRQVIDVTSGTVAQAVDYDVNGVVARNTNPGFQPFGFAGGLNDPDGRMVHFGARDYDARTGRWVQPDPIGAMGGSNRFEYAGKDPVNLVDPQGTVVEFRGSRAAELRAAWGRLLREMRDSKDQTGQMLYKKMIDMQQSNHLYIVGQDDNMGPMGRSGPPDGPQAWQNIWLNFDNITNYGGGMTPDEILAHELGHLWWHNSGLSKLNPGSNRPMSNQQANAFEAAYRKKKGLPVCEPIHSPGSEW